MSGRHRRGKHRKNPTVHPFLTAAAVTAALLTMVVAVGAAPDAVAARSETALVCPR